MPAQTIVEPRGTKVRVHIPAQTRGEHREARVLSRLGNSPRGKRMSWITKG